MKTYTTTAELWRKGLLVPAGTPLTLTDTEAKYIAHALQPETAAGEVTVAASDPELATDEKDDEPAKRGAKRRVATADGE